MATEIREDEIHTIKAQLSKIIFFAPNSSFCIGAFKDRESGKSFTAKGTLRDPVEGSVYLLSGQYVVHEKYGRQFSFVGAEPHYEADPASLQKFLTSKKQAALSKKKAEKLYELMGEDLLSELSEHPERIEEADFLSRQEQAQVVESIGNYVGGQSIIMDLLRAGLRHKEIDLLKESYEPGKLRQALLRDPFDPFYEISGFGYASSLKIADEFQLPAQDLRRARAAIYDAFRTLIYQTGSTWLSQAQLAGRVSYIPPERFDMALANLVETGRIHREGDRLYPELLYRQEWTISRFLKDHAELSASRPKDLEERLERLQERLGLHYDESQKEAISTFFDHPLLILNGGPGTGKSTVVEAIVELLQRYYPAKELALCAPTGRAAKRMEEITGIKSRTIHSMLHWNINRNSFAKNDRDPLDVDFLIVDESSMIDTHLFGSLLRALPDSCRILYIGDEFQLESVGPGRVLNDLIESDRIKVVSLGQVHRTREGSTISQLAKDIKEGNRLTHGSDVRFVFMPDEAVLDYLRERFQQDPDGSIQILAPMYEGPAGIHAINRMAQEFFNPFHPAKEQLVLKNVVFRRGDRILLKKNLSEKDVFNGDIGTIEEIDMKSRTVTVNFDGKLVDFSEDLPAYLTHAWCISIHKSQGSEYQDVICVFPEKSKHMLSRRLIYTAVSRAKRDLEIIGNEKSFTQGISRISPSQRNTGLKEKIDQVFSREIL